MKHPFIHKIATRHAFSQVILLAALVVLTIFIGGLVFFNLKVEGTVGVEAVEGEVRLEKESQANQTSLKSGDSDILNPGEILEILPKSIVNLVFENGQNITLAHPGKFELILSKNSDGHKLYVFNDKNSQKSFVFNSQEMQNLAPAAVLSYTPKNDRILGATETKPSYSDSEKLEKLNAVNLCMQTSSDLPSNQEYDQKLDQCLEKSGLQFLADLE